ncbi:PAS domain S-box protein [Candidatus Aerophobetes bacterium]|nr:PAS domain S-box protein [Candidatus Aerophobetes bacterium]
MKDKNILEKLQEEALGKETAERKTILDNLTELVVLQDKEQRVLWANRAATESLGLSISQIIGKYCYELWHQRNTPCKGCPVTKTFKMGAPQQNEVKTPDGRWWFISASPLKDEQGNVIGAIETALDITKRKKLEEALRKSEEKFRLMVSEVKDYAIFMLDPDGIVSSWNEGAEYIKGYTQEEIIGQHFSQFYTKEDREKGKPNKELKIALAKGRFEDESWRVRKDGSLFFAHAVITPLKDKTGKLVGFAKITQEITERKRSEERIKRLYSMQKVIRRINQVLLRAKGEPELFQRICELLLQIEDFKFVWIGFLQEKTFEVKPVAYAGFERGYLSSIKLRWDDSKYGMGPTGRAIKEGKPFIIRDIENDPRYAPWRKEALKRGYKSSISLSLSHAGEVIGALNIYSGEKDAFQDEEVEFLKEAASDIAIGIKSLRVEKELERTVKQLEATTEGIIWTVAKIVEARDPYTSGHQERVAKLARAIAEEMDLPQDQIKGIYMTAIIHDIGKIYVPSEILSKPGRLTKIEFYMIKTHPQYGYNMLKDVDFPWPVALTILQHHERMDGSGYPQGLSGKDIVLEARILGIADVVEAMSSHRPYRAALGIDKALDEILKNKGKLYDCEVVDTCMKLFKEKEFKFQ